jgi:hypothetical protein
MVSHSWILDFGFSAKDAKRYWNKIPTPYLSHLPFPLQLLLPSALTSLNSQHDVKCTKSDVAFLSGRRVMWCLFDLLSTFNLALTRCGCAAIFKLNRRPSPLCPAVAVLYARVASCTILADRFESASLPLLSSLLHRSLHLTIVFKISWLQVRQAQLQTQPKNI